MRHSKTEAQEIFGSDFVRNLTANGHNQTEIQAKFMALLPFHPDLVLVSPANRTQQTLQGLLPHLSWDKTHFETKDKLYHASLSQLLDIISNTKDEIEELMIIGHNFGLLELVQQFTGQYIPKFKTGSLALYHFNVDSWSQLQIENAELKFIKAPLDD